MSGVRSKKWTVQDRKTALQMHAEGADDGTIADALGRSVLAISAWRWANGLGVPAENARAWLAVISEHWGKLYPDEIGKLIGLSAERVCKVANSNGLGDHGLPKRAPNTTVQQATPSRPKGYTPSQLLWAHAYAGDRQADLITSLASGKRVGRGYGPRT